jgi:hypothetical protein
MIGGAPAGRGAELTGAGRIAVLWPGVASASKDWTGAGTEDGWLMISGGAVVTGTGGIGMLTGRAGVLKGGFRLGPVSVVGTTEVDFGVVRPLTRGNAIGESNTPRSSDTHVAHAGSNALTCGGNDNCGAQRLAIGVLTIGSSGQLDMQVHVL